VASGVGQILACPRENLKRIDGFDRLRGDASGFYH